MATRASTDCSHCSVVAFPYPWDRLLIDPVPDAK